jgi:hypothetical protein
VQGDLDGAPGSGTGTIPAHRRWAFLGLGWVFFGLGLLGIVLPLLPATPLMLLALWAFSRGSQRFHDWLYHHRVFGPPLQRFRRERTVPLWAKALALSSMAASLTYVALVVRPAWYGLAAMGAVVLAGAVYITRFPSRPAEGARDGGAPGGPR